IMRVQRDAEGRMIGLASGAPHDTDDGDDGDVVVESMMHVEVDRETDADVLETTRLALVAALADLRAAASDWMPMLAALRHVADVHHEPDRHPGRAPQAAVGHRPRRFRARGTRPEGPHRDPGELSA